MIVALSIGLIRSSEITSGLWILPRCPKVLIGYIYHHDYSFNLKIPITVSNYPTFSSIQGLKMPGPLHLGQSSEQLTGISVALMGSLW